MVCNITQMGVLQFTNSGACLYSMIVENDSYL